MRFIFSAFAVLLFAVVSNAAVPIAATSPAMDADSPSASPALTRDSESREPSATAVSDDKSDKAPDKSIDVTVPKTDGPTADSAPPASAEPTAAATAEPVTPKAAPLQVQEAKPELAGDVRAPSPKALDPNRRGFFQLGVGPAYGAGFKSDSLMYDVVGSYNFNLSDVWTAKAIADLALATGTVSSRIINFAVGAEYYIPDVKIGTATPYVAGDVGLAFGRNAIAETATAAALGVGAGFKFEVAQLNFDINGHYEQLTAPVGDAAPSIFAVRGSLTF